MSRPLCFSFFYPVLPLPSLTFSPFPVPSPTPPCPQHPLSRNTPNAGKATRQLPHLPLSCCLWANWPGFHSKLLPLPGVVYSHNDQEAHTQLHWSTTQQQVVVVVAKCWSLFSCFVLGCFFPWVSSLCCGMFTFSEQLFREFGRRKLPAICINDQTH